MKRSLLLENAKQKRELARSMLAEGKTASVVNRVIKEKFGIGIRQQSLVDIKRELGLSKPQIKKVKRVQRRTYKKDKDLILFNNAEIDSHGALRQILFTVKTLMQKSGIAKLTIWSERDIVEYEKVLLDTLEIGET